MSRKPKPYRPSPEEIEALRADISRSLTSDFRLMVYGHPATWRRLTPDERFAIELAEAKRQGPVDKKARGCLKALRRSRRNA